MSKVLNEGSLSPISPTIKDKNDDIIRNRRAYTVNDGILSNNNNNNNINLNENEIESVDDISIINDTNNKTSGSSSKKCHVCGAAFGIRKMRRKHTCRKCKNKVCNPCSKKRRWDNTNKQHVRVCNNCLKYEHSLYIKSRLKDLKLKYNKKTGGTYVCKVQQNGHEYKLGLMNKCKIVEINFVNVEHLPPQNIADKLNNIKLPFTLLLDYAVNILYSIILICVDVAL